MAKVAPIQVELLVPELLTNLATCPVCYCLTGALLKHLRWHNTMTNQPMTPEQEAPTPKEEALLQLALPFPDA